MKTLLRILPLAACGILLVHTGCTTTTATDRRIEKNPAMYGKLSGDDKLLVQKSQIREGMTKDAVYLAWGPADRVRSGRDRGQTVETWIYDGFGGPHTTLSVGYGYGYGYGGPFWPYGYGFYGPPAYYPIADGPMAEVKFQNGRVIAWQSERR